MEDYLTTAELIRVTGTPQPARQAKFLRETLGMNVWPNRKNEVVVSREALIRCQLGARDVVQDEPRVRAVSA